MKSTNPFDDSPKVSTGGGAGTNPFSDDNEDDNPSFIGTSGGTSNSDTYFSTNTIKNNDNTTAALNTVSMSHTTGSTVEPSSIMAGGPSESPWQDLGDLPYRRVHLYSNVSWGCTITNNNHKDKSQQQQQQSQSGQSSQQTNSEEEMNEERFGLSWYPKSYVDAIRSHQNVSGDASEVARLLSTTTTTLVAGCPNGGPIAAVTIPLLSSGSISGSAGGGMGSSGFGSKTTIRIMNNAGSILAKIPFPPPKQELLDLSTTSTATVMQHRGPGDILTIGFTSRCVLVVVLRDSLTLCYDLSGKSVLPPFFSLKFNSGSHHTPSPSRGGKVKLSGTELLEARVYEGGVAVLGVDMNSAIVELLDEHDDPAYADGMDISSRRIVPKSTSSSSSDHDPTRGDNSSSASPFFLAPPPHYAIVTPLPTSMFARSKHLSFGCIAVLPRQYSPSGRPELFLSTSDGSVVVAEANPSTSPNNGLTDVDCRSRINDGGGMGSSSAPIISMAFAPNGRFLACFTSNSILTVVSTTFESKVLEFSTSSGSSSPPRSMAWCGEDSVVLHWKDLGVLLVGPYGDWLRFPYGEEDEIGAAAVVGSRVHGDSEVYLVQEMDCCRVLTSNVVELLQRVPPGTADLLRIGSIEPGALLLDASDAFDSGSSNADEAARSITAREGLLSEAILDCVAAAVGEFDVRVQKRMLRAASYGLHFACKDETYRNKTPGRPSHEAVAFVRASRKLRVLNAIRRQGIGFAMTSAQYDAVMPKGVVARLMAAGRPSLAASVSEYLKLGRRVRDYARAMKASAFVSSPPESSMTNSQIAEEAIRIIQGKEKGGKKTQDEDEDSLSSPPSSGMYASVALAAHRSGRKGVADLLIMLEEGPEDKVHALLTIGAYADAAAVAAKARDSNLIYTTICAYEGGLPNNEEGKSLYFSGIINKFPTEAVNMFTSYYCRLGTLAVGDANPAVNIFLRRQKHTEAGLMIAKKALLVESMEGNKREKQKIEMLKDASKIFDVGGKDCAFQKACVDEQIQLMAEQEQLRLAYGSNEVAPPSSSVTSTIMSILKHGAVDQRSAHKLNADAERIAKKFKVPEKRLWHVKVRAFSESGQWAVMRNFCDSRAKPPIGMKPFALAAIKGKQGEAEIMHYVSRMQDKTDADDRYDLLCEAGLWKKALEEAVKQGDGRKIANVRSLCNNPDVQRLCDKYI
mmetsp:Transcript_25905/g.51954  ORF Transcript_25905/g.51954 Transcript_25905/m.51954 type:complete len:1193 (-) Transcript_25905:1429-5007(-)